MINNVILNWALKGLESLRRLTRFEQCAESKKILGEHRLDCDHEREFLTDMVEVKRGSSIPAQQLYNTYKVWMLENGNNPMSMQRFKKSVERFNPCVGLYKNRANGKNESTWKNLAFAESKCVDLYSAIAMARCIFVSN